MDMNDIMSGYTRMIILSPNDITIGQIWNDYTVIVHKNE